MDENKNKGKTEIALQVAREQGLEVEVLKMSRDPDRPGTGLPEGATVRVTTFDWKESPDADDLQEALEDFGVRVYSPESAGDFSVFVFSDKDLTDEQVVLACEEAGVGDAWTEPVIVTCYAVCSGPSPEEVE